MDNKELMELEQQFATRFRQNPKGNYVSAIDRATIYKRGGLWMYCKEIMGKTRFGRNQYPTALDCFTWMVKNRVISMDQSTPMGFAYSPERESE